MSDQILDKLADYVQRKVSKDPTRPLEPDTPLVSSGLVDSLSLISVLVYIEDEFGVVIPDEAATAAAMNTIRQIGAMIDVYRRPEGT